jgi:ferredoxin
MSDHYNSLPKIPFSYFKNLFDESWDVGVISADNLKKCTNYPIKHKAHKTGDDYTNNIHFNGISNTLILIKTGHTWDYTHYDEAKAIMETTNYVNWFQVYTNFKEAAILSGLGVRARNSLIYSYKFGFDCHICAIGIQNEIIDLPLNKRTNYKLWPRCKNCYDCVDACPAGAIHGKEEPYWLDSAACDNFIGLSDHPTVPSIKKFWRENIHPEISKEETDKLKTWKDVEEKFLGPLPFDANGYTFDGNVTKKNGTPVNVPFCRECTSQPRCSKWNGKYPYDSFDPNPAKETINQPIQEQSIPITFYYR